jgi:hypothetical protein
MFKEKDHRDTDATGAASDASGGKLGDLSNEMRNLLRAGEAAIDQGLSQDSEAYLRMNRQTGGQ